MGQIVSTAAKPKRCNLNKLSQLGILAAGEHVLVSYDNSMNAAGQGNFDRYIVGDGRTAATALELRYLDDSTRPYIVEEVNKAVAGIQPIEITGDVTNAPDEEDLTSENQGGTDVLKFKDKAYNAALYSGLGRVYLRKNIVTLEGTGKNVLTQAMVNTANTIYHIQYDYDLNGQTITLPAGCVLEFDGGSVKNGVLVGNNTGLKYSAQFLNDVELRGTFTTDGIPYDADIFSDNSFSTKRIASMFCIYGEGNKIAFSQNTYTDVSTININRDIDADFGGSTIYLHVDETTMLPDPFIFMEYAAEGDGVIRNKFHIKNLTIYGNLNHTYNNPVGTGARRRLIQLFNVKDIRIENCKLNNLRTGTSGNYHNDLKERYELSLISLFHFYNVLIDGVICRNCSADNIFYCKPNTTYDNKVTCRNCSHIGYTGLLLALCCQLDIHDNYLENNTSSSFNIMGAYNSEIYNNEFVNGSLHDCFDLSMDGTYTADNVHIHNNKCTDESNFATINGSNILIEDNDIRASVGFFVTKQGTSADFTRTVNPEDNYGGIVIRNNTFNVGTLTRINSLYNDYNDITINDNKVLAYDNSSPLCPIELNYFREIIISGNYIHGYGAVTGAARSSYITLSANSSVIESLEISGNYFDAENTITYADNLTLVALLGTTLSISATQIYDNIVKNALQNLKLCNEPSYFAQKSLFENVGFADAGIAIADNKEGLFVDTFHTLSNKYSVKPISVHFTNTSNNFSQASQERTLENFDGEVTFDGDRPRWVFYGNVHLVNARVVTMSVSEFTPNGATAGSEFTLNNSILKLNVQTISGPKGFTLTNGSRLILVNTNIASTVTFSCDDSSYVELVKGTDHILTKDGRTAVAGGASRPSLNALNVGYVFFDTTLGKPIWWNGTAWVDATGVPAADSKKIVAITESDYQALATKDSNTLYLITP